MKRIVIVGAGFAGLAAAKALRHSDAEVFVVDRANHNLFQPLLYQVATTVLSPAQIASPIRGLLKNQRNTIRSFHSAKAKQIICRRSLIPANPSSFQR